MQTPHCFHRGVVDSLFRWESLQSESLAAIRQDTRPPRAARAVHGRRLEPRPSARPSRAVLNAVSAAEVIQAMLQTMLGWFYLYYYSTAAKYKE